MPDAAHELLTAILAQLPEEQLEKMLAEKHAEKFCQQGPNAGKPGPCPGAARSSASTPVAPRRHAPEIPAPGARQQQPWSCGAAVLRAVDGLVHGMDLGEPYYRHLAGTNPDTGMPPEAMVRALRQLGLRPQPREGMSAEDLAQAIDQHQPVVMCLQAWGGGHWALCVGRDGDEFHFVDPALPEDQRGVMSAEDLAERWWDEDSEGRRYDRYGIVVRS